MKMKKRLWSILLSLVLVLGLVPGMSLTAYAAPTETLLTTITATGKEQASYSTAGVATVSFSYTANGSSSYTNNGTTATWGWWGYGWSATVNAVDGYTITKCVFYDDKDRTATDSEAPFVVETTEEDKTPQVNGAPILAYQSKGITKIEVYGYATPAHTHDFTYSASGATITATCTAGCPDSYDTTPATLTIAAAGGTYDGTTAYGATVTNNIPAVTGDTVGSTAYYKVNTEGATTGGTAQTGAPTDAGYYYASVTLTSGSNTYTAVKAFTVAKADPTAPTGLTATYGQKLSDVALPTGWTWADSTQSVGSVVSPAATFKANFAGDDNYNAASNVDVTVTVGKADATDAMKAAAVSLKATKDQTATVSYTLPEGTTYGAVTNENTAYFTVDTSNGLTLTAAKNWTADEWGEGTKTFTVAMSGTNYNDYTLTVTVTPTYKQAQAITASDVTATYGDTDKSVSATTDGNGEISYTVKAGSENYIDVNTSTGALTIKAVPADGKAYVTVTAAETTTGGTGGNGYAAATKDVTVTVEPKTVGLTWGESSFTYDGKSHAPTATATGTVNGDEIAVTVSGGQTNASTTAYTATATDLTGEKASNYKLPDAVTHTFTIGQKAVTITAGSDTKVYDGVALTKNSYTNSDLAEGDSIQSVTVTGSQTVVGKIDNVPSAAVIKHGETDVTANYNITYAKGTLEVTQKAVTITAESDTKVYDGTALTKNAVTNSGLASGDRIASVTVTGSQTVKGKSDNVASAVKIVNAKGDDVTACYNVTYSKGSLEVTARPVTVTPQNNSKTYGESDPELTATVTDLVPGETLNYTLSRETGETANTYTISVNLGSNPNYSVTTGTATFTIHKAELPDLKVTLESWTYGDTPNTPVVEGNVENGDVSFTYREAGLKALPAGDGFSAATPTDMGEYEVKVTVAETANYNGSEAIGKFTIAPKSIAGGTVKLVSDKLEFTGQEQKVEIKEVKTKDGMTVDTYTVKGVTTATDCNTYTVTVTGTGNYKDEATTTWKIYKVDENKSEATDGTRTVTGEVNTTPDAPETTANVDLDFAKSLLDDGDSATENVNVYLQVDQKDKNDLSDTDKNAVGKELKTNSGVGMYVNMELYKKVGDEAAEAQATSKPLTVTMTVPAEEQTAAQPGYTRTFSVLQVVNGVATTVAGAKYDAKTGQITFPATQFTTDNQEVTYALVYTDTAKGGNGEFISLGGGSAASSTMSSFTMTTDLTGINKVTVDGKTVDPQYYTVSGGNVTLSPDYIKTLRSGTHILQAENATHVSTAKFTVKSALTADGGTAIYVSMMALGLMAAAALIASHKRRQYCR